MTEASPKTAAAIAKPITPMAVSMTVQVLKVVFTSISGFSGAQAKLGDDDVCDVRGRAHIIDGEPALFLLKGFKSADL